MPGLRFLVVDHPLLKLPVLADLQRRQAIQDALPCGHELLVAAQYGLRLREPLENIHRQRDVHRRRDRQRHRADVAHNGVLRRLGGNRHQVPVRVFDQICLPEPRALLQERVAAVAQEFLIARELPPLPVVHGQPTRRADPHVPPRRPRGAGRPRACRDREVAPVGAVYLPGSLPRGWDHRIEQREQRVRALRQARHLRRPVVHLQVHVHVEVAVPRRLDVLVPDAL